MSPTALKLHATVVNSLLWLVAFIRIKNGAGSFGSRGPHGHLIEITNRKPSNPLQNKATRKLRKLHMRLFVAEKAHIVHSAHYNNNLRSDLSQNRHTYPWFHKQSAITIGVPWGRMNKPEAFSKSISGDFTCGRYYPKTKVIWTLYQILYISQWVPLLRFANQNPLVLYAFIPMLI